MEVMMFESQLADTGDPGVSRYRLSASDSKSAESWKGYKYVLGSLGS